MIAPRHEIARLHSDFYRNQFRKMLRWLIYSIVLVYLLIACILFLLFVQPKQDYYANTPEGKIMPMPAAERG